MSRVMIIEDEPNINLVLKAFLQGEGHDVTTAADGLAGLRQLAKSPKPDIIFVDLRMPGISGRTVIETINSNPGLCHIPVVIISGTVPNPIDFPPEGSYRELIVKPFDLRDIAKAVINASPKGSYIHSLDAPAVFTG